MSFHSKRRETFTPLVPCQKLQALCGTQMFARFVVQKMRASLAQCRQTRLPPTFVVPCAHCAELMHRFRCQKLRSVRTQRTAVYDISRQTFCILQLGEKLRDFIALLGLNASHRRFPRLVTLGPSAVCKDDLVIFKQQMDIADTGDLGLLDPVKADQMLGRNQNSALTEHYFGEFRRN